MRRSIQIINVNLYIIAGRVDEKATQLHAIASLKVLLDATKPQNGAASTSAANHVTLTTQSGRETRLAVSEQPNGVVGGIEEAVESVSDVHVKLFYGKRIGNAVARQALPPASDVGEGKSLQMPIYRNVVVRIPALIDNASLSLLLTVFYKNFLDTP